MQTFVHILLNLNFYKLYGLTTDLFYNCFIQEACRRVADHCTHLLDAVLIFKSWFIQKQLSSNVLTEPNGDFENSTLTPESLVPVQSQLSMERDWAVLRVKKYESQLDRLKHSCVAMRAQLQAGLRNRYECDQLKRELELLKVWLF